MLKGDLCDRITGESASQDSERLGESMNLEKELLDAFDRVVHGDYPNRRRINCPGSSALEKLAVAPDSDHPASILNHIRQCAPCFDEVRELRRKRIRQSP